MYLTARLPIVQGRVGYHRNRLSGGWRVLGGEWCRVALIQVFDHCE